MNRKERFAHWVQVADAINAAFDEWVSDTRFAVAMTNKAADMDAAGARALVEAAAAATAPERDRRIEAACVAWRAAEDQAQASDRERRRRERAR